MDGVATVAIDEESRWLLGYSLGGGQEIVAPFRLLAILHLLYAFLQPFSSLSFKHCIIHNIPQLIDS